jgi:hippurate hydrolase
MSLPAPDLVAEMTAWRRDLHAHPEFGFEEHRTSSKVAALLKSFGGLEVIEGVGGTGVVATLAREGGGPVIGLRADMDALRITERSRHAHASKTAGIMHACGHDGHTAMLLGAARMLVEDPAFRGAVHLPTGGGVGAWGPGHA